MDYSPALSVTSDMTDEELDKYFATYVPLSHLPTPPPVKELSAPGSASSQAASSAPELEVYATHLANLVPTNVSTHRPHCAAIRGFLQRANLPDEVVAFAACVLDALSWRFASVWRESLVPSEFERDLRTFLRTDSSRQHAHINPDVIVLAALSLAHGFLVDRLRSSRHWAIKEGDGVFSVQEIEATKRAMLQDMDYGLFRIQDEMVQRMLTDMQRPKTMATSTVARQGSVSKHTRQRTFSLNLTGTAIWSHGVQTPEPSP